MTSIKVITHEVYYAISNAMNVEEHSSLQKAQQAANLKIILKRTVGYSPLRSRAGSLSYNYAVEVAVYNACGTPVKSITEGDWSMQLTRLGKKTGDIYTCLWVKFSHLSKTVKEEKFEFSPDGFITAYQYFHSLQALRKEQYTPLLIEEEPMLKMAV